MLWYLSYWVLPAISACMWLGMLLAMLIVWSTSRNRHLPSMEPGQNIAYISDVGAFGLKPLFITGSVITVVFLNLGFMAGRWLRHTGKLARNTSNTQKILDLCSLAFATAGAAGLILLSIFDTYHHNTVHNTCLGIFLGGYVISAIFLCAEYQRLGIHYRQHRVLAISFWIKLFFIFTEVILAIVFGVTSWTHHRNVAAVFEWIVAFIFTFYVLSFIIDLWPGMDNKHHVPQGLKEEAGMAERGVANEPMTQRFSQQSTRGPSFENNNTTQDPKLAYEGADQPPTKKQGMRRFF